MEFIKKYEGEYFTPDILTLKADEYLSWYLGDQYKDEYYVWDCAAGTGNLTRNFKYTNLYQSTLHNSDLQTMKQSGINPEGTKFQFDFLNDDLDKITDTLMDAFKENKKILFYINPPYATSGNFSNIAAEETQNKSLVSDTKIKTEMQKADFGRCVENLYAQFFYRIWKIKKQFNLTNLSIGIFCPELFISGGSYDKFREKFLKDFKYENGFLTPASLFSDVSKSWGILFSVWNSGKSKNLNDFSVEIYDTDEEGLNIENKGTKILYNLDNKKEASKWVREKIKGIKTTKDIPQMTSALNIKTKGEMRGSLIPNSLGYFYNDGNNVKSNNQNVSIFTSTFSNGNGVSITKPNIFEVVTLFTSRRLISGHYDNWVNHQAEYLAPNEEHSEWEQFKYDSIVYSLFDSKSNQSSLRNIDFQDKKHQIFNEFFWVPLDKMKEAIRQSSNQDLYKDIQLYGKQRYVAELLYEQGIYDKLSDDAKYIIDEATKYVIKSIGVRDVVDRSRPELNANSWDAGWYQLKGISSEIVAHKSDIRNIMDVYKEFGDRLRPLVYELGFLKIFIKKLK